MSLINEKSFLRRKEFLYLLVIFFPLLVSLPLILYYSRISQVPRKGVTAGLVFEDKFNDCSKSNSNWLSQVEGGWSCLETGGFDSATTSGYLASGLVPSLRPVSCLECDFNRDDTVNLSETNILTFCQGSTGPYWRYSGSVSCKAADLNLDNRVDILDQDFWKYDTGCSQYFGKECSNLSPTLTPSLSVTPPSSISATPRPTATTTITPTPTPTLIPVTCNDCDFNQDKVVNFTDVDLIASNESYSSCFNSTGPYWKIYKGISCQKADLNRDNRIDSKDQDFWRGEGGCSQYFGKSCSVLIPTGVSPSPGPNGAYTYLLPSASPDRPRVTFSVLKDINEVNLTMETMINLKEISGGPNLLNNGAGIQARVSLDDISKEIPQIGGYLCFLKKDKLALQRYQLATASGEIQPLDLATRNVNLVGNTWYKLKMTLGGENLRCVISDSNGSQLMEVSYDDNNSLTDYEEQAGFTQSGPLFTKGTVGFVSYLTPVYFDNLKIEALPGPSIIPTPSATKTPTPTVTPFVKARLTIKAQFDGFTALSKGKMTATLKTKGTNFSKVVTLYEDGASEEIPLENLEPGKTYEFILSSFGYLSSRKSLLIVSGLNPLQGYLDFGLLKAGDLNGDDQINGLDWSLLKNQYGENGEE